MPVTGYLRFNDAQRWEIVPETKGLPWELSSGHTLEILIAGHWVKISIEHAAHHYFSTTPGTRLEHGLRARKP